VALADEAALPLQDRGHIWGLTPTLPRSATLDRHTEGEVMWTRRDFRAITRGAQARPGAALILGGLLLLTLP